MNYKYIHIICSTLDYFNSTLPNQFMSNSSPKSISSCIEFEDDNIDINDNDNDSELLRRGPWTLGEDNLLINSIAQHGEGRWNLLANRSGLRRTGKSCRLRWLNYLKPDVKRGNLSAQEQLLILDLHSKWGNRWSKIAQHLPGRTDNEIKNYWRTKVQKQARILNIDTNSETFQQIIRCYWMPRLIQKINQSSPSTSPPPLPEFPVTSAAEIVSQGSFGNYEAPVTAATPLPIRGMNGGDLMGSSCNSSSSSSSQVTQISGYPDYDNYWHDGHGGGEIMNWATAAAATGESSYPVAHCHMADSNWMDSDYTGYMSNVDELWQF